MIEIVMEVDDEFWNIINQLKEFKGQKEIIHCKDCRHKCIKGKTTQYHYCEIWKSAVDETDFCSRGERRDEID